jgi:hypothetical protein
LHIETRTLSAVSAENFNNVFTSANKLYKIIIDVLPSTTLDINMRLRVGGSDDSSSVYNRQLFLTNGTVLQGSRTNDQNLWQLNGGATVHRQFHEMILINPANTVLTGMYNNAMSNYNSTNSNAIFINNHAFTNTTAFDGFSIITSTGNITGFASIFAFKE